MSFANLFNGGSARRGASQPSRRPSSPRRSGEEAAEERIGSRLNRYTARAEDGLESAFVPEELGTMFVTARVVPFEEAEGRTRPL